MRVKLLEDTPIPGALWIVGLPLNYTYALETDPETPLGALFYIGAILPPPWSTILVVPEPVLPYYYKGPYNSMG